MFDIYAVYRSNSEVGKPLIATCSLKKLVRKLKRIFPERKDEIGEYVDNYGYKDYVLLAKLSDLLDGIRILGLIDGYDYENHDNSL